MPSFSAHRSAQSQVSKKLLYIIISIILFGLFMVYDASSVYAQRLFKGDSTYFVRFQTFWVLLGLVLFILFASLRIEVLKKYAKGLFFVTLVFLGLLGITSRAVPCKSALDESIPFFPCVNYARRWVYINPSPLPKIPGVGILSFQASELAKFSLVIFLPLALEAALRLKNNKAPLIKLAGIAGSFSFLVFLEPNMSNAILIFLIGLLIYFVSGASLRILPVLLPFLAVVLLALTITSPYRMKRFTTFISGHNSKTETSLKENYQISQITLALGRGGFFGVGLGQSKQKLSYTPEVYADSIFAIVGEELGYLGSIFCVGLFLAFALKGIEVVLRTPSLYEKMVAAGIVSWIFFQFIINISAMSGLIPLTGMPIPLFSYGGSSMLFSMAALGVLYGISKNLRD